MENCPNCDRSGIGSTVITMETRGTRQTVEGTLCSNCGTVYVSEQQRERLREGKQELLKEEMRESGLSEDEIDEIERRFGN